MKPTGAQSDPRPWIGGLVAMSARSRSPKARGDAAEASGLSLKAREVVTRPLLASKVECGL